MTLCWPELKALAPRGLEIHTGTKPKYKKSEAIAVIAVPM